jgi:hypothetical protein
MVHQARLESSNLCEFHYCASTFFAATIIKRKLAENTMNSDAREFPKIDIEAQPVQDILVDMDILQQDISAIHGEAWDEARNAPDADDPLVAALIQWLGKDRVMEMTPFECDHLRNAVSRLPDPVGPQSFAWDAIKEPSDIRRVSEAVVIYRRFNPAAVAISEALGNNDEVRRIIASQAGQPHEVFGDFVKAKRSDLQHVTTLKSRIDGLRTPFASLFGKEEISIEAAVVAITAAKGIGESLHHMRSGLALVEPVADEHLEAMDKLRRHTVTAADKVARITGINPMRYSPAVLSGVRRSLGPDATGDYDAAIEGLGGVLDGNEELIEQSRIAFTEFFAQTGAFNLLLTQMGLTTDDLPALLANVLVRRHLVSAARTAGIEWEAVKDDLSLAAKASYEEIEEYVLQADAPGMTGHLRAVSKNRMARPLNQVAKAAHSHIITQEFWLSAADRVVDVQDDLRFVDLREVLRMEPEIDTAKQLLKDCGANTSDDVTELQNHLEWMISAFALPINDEAVESIITSKAEVIPMRLCKA